MKDLNRLTVSVGCFNALDTFYVWGKKGRGRKEKQREVKEKQRNIHVIHLLKQTSSW